MLFPALLSTFLFGISAVDGAAFNPTRRTCGTTISDSDLVAAEAHFAAHKVSPKNLTPKTVILNIYFHVVSSDLTLEGGNIPDSQVEEQVLVMNQDFASTGISWVLANLTRTVNATWFDTAGPNSVAQTEMKQSLRQGGDADLNVYSVGFVSGSGQGLLGYATFPADNQQAPLDDGVVILFSSVPGGTTVPYDLGRTLTHEAGHWVGLYHTFQGGCFGSGDMVDDTPAEARPEFGCTIGRDTCSSVGLDPVQNFMDYSIDSCMTNFTPGQTERIRDQMLTYRRISI